jgi:class 3 adenylate cyclase/alpha-beta hydrolase superfamily lysophospholipase
MDVPETRYARSGDVSVAYQVFGGGPVDLVVIRGSLSELSSAWEQPLLAKHFEGLASLARVMVFDKRGMGLSDRLREVPTLETRMDDIRCVMDAASSERVVLWAAHEGTRIAVLFAATYPERTRALVLFDPYAKGKKGPDYPWARDEEEWRAWFREVADGWGSTEFFERYLETYSPSLAGDPEARQWFVRHMRQSASPGAALAFQRMVMEGDVTDVLPAIRVPTLVLHRPESAGRAEYVASKIPGAVSREVPSLVDSYSWADPVATEFIVNETRAFLDRLGQAAEPERVLATILFTDIVGSTDRAAGLGDEEWKNVLARHQAIVRRRLAQFRGEELNTTGDGFLASFDGPGRGVRCACAIRDDAPELGLEIRAGLHTGEAERLGSDIGGIAVHIAARVAAVAAAGEVLVSSTVKDLVAGSGLEFEERGDHALKGVPGAWHLFAAVG